MKQLFLTLMVVMAFFNIAISQQNYPQGLYMSFEEIKAQQPSVQCSLQVVRRTQFDIKMNGGNDYRIESSSKNDKKNIKNKAWAYSDGDTLYVNCAKFKAQPWYAKVDASGKFLLFHAGVSKHTPAQTTKALLTGYMFGLVGGAISGTALAKMRFLYAVSTENGQLELITLKFLDNVLASGDTELYSEFKKDMKTLEAITDYDWYNKTQEVLIWKYAKHIND